VREDDDNPFDSISPAESEVANTSFPIWCAKLGWYLPLIGFGLFVLSALLPAYSSPFAVSFLLAAGGFGCIFAGFLVTAWASVLRSRCPAMVGHVQAGILLNSLMLGLIVLTIVIAVQAAFQQQLKD